MKRQFSVSSHAAQGQICWRTCAWLWANHIFPEDIAQGSVLIEGDLQVENKTIFSVQTQDNSPAKILFEVYARDTSTGNKMINLSSKSPMIYQASAHLIVAPAYFDLKVSDLNENDPFTEISSTQEMRTVIPLSDKPEV